MENYQLLTQIGSGACGSVYLVRSYVNNRQYALKKVQLDEKRKTRTREALLKEVRILSDLKHPHIVGYQDSFFTNDEDAKFIHIVQDYCDGGTLDEKIGQKRKEGGFFSESAIMEWYIQIVMALQYLHTRKILHRDIKPQNVFMTKSEGVKLGDFGIAKVLDHTLDAAMTCVGTPCYLSPELCQDIPYSSKSDIWASGCVLFEICALKPAFDAHNLISLFYKISNAQYQTIPDHYSSDLKKFLAGILVKQPELRPSASSILNLPYIRDYLESFIKDREYLLQQKIISLKAKSDNPHGSSPKMRSRNQHGSSLLSRSTPAFISQHSQLPELTKSITPKAVSPEAVSPGAVQKPDVSSPKYSDDFDSSSSDEAEEVIEEDLPKSPLDDNAENERRTIDDESPKLEIKEEEGKEEDEEEEEDYLAATYDDDFEEDSEAEELDNIIANAREAQSICPDNEWFFDEDYTPPPGKSNFRSSVVQGTDADAVELPDVRTGVCNAGDASNKPQKFMEPRQRSPNPPSGALPLHPARGSYDPQTSSVFLTDLLGSRLDSTDSASHEL